MGGRQAQQGRVREGDRVRLCLEARNFEKKLGPQLALKNDYSEALCRPVFSTRGDEQRHQRSGKAKACRQIGTSLAAASEFGKGAWTQGAVDGLQGDLTVDSKEEAILPLQQGKLLREVFATSSCRHQHLTLCLGRERTTGCWVGRVCKEL